MSTTRLRTRTTKKTVAGIAGLLLLAAPLAACGSEDEGDGGSGSSSSEVQKPLAEIKDLSAAGGDTQVTLDQGFADALGSLNVEAAPFKDATFANGAFTFPITGGDVQLFTPGTVHDYVVGQVQHENSGIDLTAGDTTVTVGNFNVDPVFSLVFGDVAVNGKLAVTSVPIFDLNGSTLKAPDLEQPDTVVLEGSGVFLTDVAAGLLNDTFGIDDLAGGLKVGVAKITVNKG